MLQLSSLIFQKQIAIEIIHLTKNLLHFYHILVKRTFSIMWISSFFRVNHAMWSHWVPAQKLRGKKLLIFQAFSSCKPTPGVSFNGGVGGFVVVPLTVVGLHWRWECVEAQIASCYVKLVINNKSLNCNVWKWPFKNESNRDFAVATRDSKRFRIDSENFSRYCEEVETRERLHSIDWDEPVFG